MITKKEVISEYKKYCELFNSVAKEKSGGIITAFDKANAEAVSEKLCSGSDMFLGYYNPSLVYDLVVGNVHRGRLLTRVTKRTKPTHRYRFDDKNRLLTMVEIPEQGMENIDDRAVVFYENDSVIIVHFSCSKNSTSTNVIAQCVFDDENRIVKFTVGEMVGNRCSFVTQETYSYSQQGVVSVCIWECCYITDSMLEMFSNPIGITVDTDDLNRHICQANRYSFYHDDDGYIVKYDAVDKNGESTTYEIAKSKRRKV